MGNCLRRESSMQWGGDDWGSPVPDDRFFSSNTRQKQEKIINIQEKGLKTISSTINTSSTEVKIKITKKQLEELLGKVDMKELSIEQVLAQLMNKVSDPSFETHQRSWRPNLQSIPE